jgi:hypothetical protein
MSGLTFSINFRRQAWQREQARQRQRVFRIGAWVAWFGLFALAFGLHLLNTTSLQRRVTLLEQQIARVEERSGPEPEWKPSPADLDRVERYVRNPRVWGRRLSRLSALLPADAVVTAIEVNPGNVSGGRAEEMMVVTGLLRSGGGADPMNRIMGYVSSLRADPGFSAGYGNIRLVSSRAVTGGGFEFTLEAR